MKRPYLIKKRGRFWYFRLAGQRTFHTTGQTTKTAAIIFADGVLQQAKPPREPGSAPAPTLSDYAADFYRWDRCAWIKRQHGKGQRFSAAVAGSRRGHLERYILPKFGALRLDELNAVQVENWLVELDLANQTRNHIFYSLNIILKEAKRERLITANPLDDVEPMAPGHRPRDIFTPAEMRLLFPIDAEELVRIWRQPRYAALFLVLATTGLRSGEARALRWLCIAWQQHGILVLQAMKNDTDVGETKTGDTRAVLVPSRTLDVLSWWREQSFYAERDDFVFYGAGRSQPVSRRTVSVNLRPALRRAGVDAAGRNLVPHSFRHTYNTMMRKVLPADQLRDQTGHRTERMTDRYDHPSLDDRLARLQDVRHVVEDVWNPGA